MTGNVIALTVHSFQHKSLSSMPDSGVHGVRKLAVRVYPGPGYIRDPVILKIWVHSRYTRVPGPPGIRVAPSKPTVSRRFVAWLEPSAGVWLALLSETRAGEMAPLTGNLSKPFKFIGFGEGCRLIGSPAERARS